MIRTFGVKTLAGAALPWLSDALTAALVAPVNSQNVLLTVADTTFYQVGDRIILNPGTATQNILRLSKIISATVLQCQSESDAKINPQASGAIIMLSIACWGVDFQNLGAGTIYLGATSSVTAVPGGSVFKALLPATANAANSWRYDKSTGQNPLNTAEGWMIGTGNVLVAALVN